MTARLARRPTMLRVTDVLALFVTGTDLGVTEVARAAGVSKSVAHRILSALAQAQFVALDAETHRYRVGPMLLRLGLASNVDADLRIRAYPHLRMINERTGETALLCILRGDRRVYVDQIEAKHPIRTSMPLGEERPLYLGSTGKAILAFLSPQLRAAIARSARGTKLANGRAIRVPELEAELETIRRRGYAVVSDELVAGLAAVAAPIFDVRGRVIASVGVAGLSSRAGKRRLLAYAAIARDEAIALSRELGWTGGESLPGRHDAIAFRAAEPRR